MRKGLLILFGESFRLGGQHSRNTGSPESFDAQIKAASSHMKWIECIQKDDVRVDVSINSYTTAYDNHLANTYEGNLIGQNFYSELIGQSALIHRCVDTLQDISAYDFVLCMRIDLCLTDKFTEVFDPSSECILFPSVCWKFLGGDKVGSHPRVNDMMMYVPKRFAHLLNKINLGHRSWLELVEEHQLQYDDLDTMLDTYHDSDSAKDFNPIYYLVNRPFSTVWHSPHALFDKHTYSP